MNAISDWTLIVVAVLGLSAGVMIGWLINHHAFACLRKAMRETARMHLSAVADAGLLQEEVTRLEAYSAELELDKAIAVESSDRWRGEAFEAQNKLSEVTELLATEKRRAAALMGWNRTYRKERAA